MTPASVGDGTGLEVFDFDLPVGTQLYADKAYTHYAMEDLLETVGIHLLPMRKSNSTRPLPPWLAFLQHHRKIVETTGSLLERLLPKSIHAVTADGFQLKMVLFVLALSFNAL